MRNKEVSYINLREEITLSDLVKILEIKHRLLLLSNTIPED